jgi:hypothetical protein
MTYLSTDFYQVREVNSFVSLFLLFRVRWNAIGICSVINVGQAKMEILWTVRQFESSNPS